MGRGAAATNGLATTGGRGGSGWATTGVKVTGNGCSPSPAALGNGGSVGPSTRRTVARRTGAASGSRRIGDGLAGKSSRWAFPTMAFFVTPSRRPISAVE